MEASRESQTIDLLREGQIIVLCGPFYQLYQLAVLVAAWLPTVCTARRTGSKCFNTPLLIFEIDKHNGTVLSRSSGALPYPPTAQKRDKLVLTISPLVVVEDQCGEPGVLVERQVHPSWTDLPQTIHESFQLA